MYPRVKVREDARGDQEEGHVTRKSPTSPLLGLKALEFLSIHDYHSPEQQHRVVFAECIARIPNSSVSDGTTRSKTINEGKKETISIEDNRVHIRASSIARPRAVLSSPDNDVAIGKKNGKATGHSSALRNHSRPQTKNAQLQFMVPIENIDIDAHLKCTVPVEIINVDGRGSTRKPKTPSDTNTKRSMPKSEDDSLSTKAVNHRTCLRGGKPNAARF